jgi:hypothetical protein
MAMDPELQKKIQIFIAAAIVIAGVRAAYVVYERHEVMKEDTQPRQETALKADYYVTPKKVHAYDLESARQQFTAQPVWVKYGYQLTYYPYDATRKKVDFGHEAGMLPPLAKLTIQDVVEAAAPQAPGIKQVLACFTFLADADGKTYAVSIGSDKGGDFKLRADDIFFIEDPHNLYKHWTADVWQKIDAHEVQPGMSELQASFALGMGTSAVSGDYGSRTLNYANGGKPLVISFENDKVVEIKPGT